jgi:hypothetical protein
METSFSAFLGHRKIFDGSLIEVALKVKKSLEKDAQASILVFNNQTSKIVDLDLRGSAAEIKKRLEEPLKSGPGRPKLGVVSREISLLPAHWEWLNIQPGGASGTLRRLVDEARKRSHKQDQVRVSQDATYNFMRVMAGDLVGYEEALRALYAREKKKFLGLVAAWPKDLRSHTESLASRAFSSSK